jgi:hypothetical protein
LENDVWLRDKNSFPLSKAKLTGNFLNKITMCGELFVFLLTVVTYSQNVRKLERPENQDYRKAGTTGKSKRQESRNDRKAETDGKAGRPE